MPLIRTALFVSCFPRRDDADDFVAAFFERGVGNAEELPKTLADCPESCFSMIVSFFELKYERIVENLRSQLEAYLVLPQIGFRLPNVPFEA